MPSIDVGPLGFYIVNLGCKVNRVEADALAAALIAQGARRCDESEADLVVVNTCTVTAEADSKARKAVRHALSANPAAQVAVTGCAVAIDAGAFSRMGPRVHVVDRARLIDELAGGADGVLRTGPGFKTRVTLKVQDGCDHACTYCIVHVARGPARSVPLEDVLREAREYFGAGAAELVLAGIDIGAYRDGETDLARLAGRILAEARTASAAGDVTARVRVSSIEPGNVTGGFVRLLAESEGRLCRHLHLPLQSGSQKVLAEMGRPYTAGEYRDLVGELREKVPGIALSTDVIVGFPGETDADFRATCDLVREAGFMRLHVFPYSPREGTPASARADQVDPATKRARAAELRRIGEELAARDLAARAGTEELALVHGGRALTESYHDVPAPAGAVQGALVPVRL